MDKQQFLYINILFFYLAPLIFYCAMDKKQGHINTDIQFPQFRLCQNLQFPQFKFIPNIQFPQFKRSFITKRA